MHLSSIQQASLLLLLSNFIDGLPTKKSITPRGICEDAPHMLVAFKTSPSGKEYTMIPAPISKGCGDFGDPDPIWYTSKDFRGNVPAAYYFTLTNSFLNGNLQPLSTNIIKSLLAYNTKYLNSGKPPIEPTPKGLISAIECCVKTSKDEVCLYSGAGKGAKAELNYDEEVNGVICRVRTADKLGQHVHWKTAALNSWWKNLWPWS